MNKSVSISAELKELWPDAALGILEYDVDVKPSSAELLQYFDNSIAQLSDTYALDTIAKNPHVAATRLAYKAFGKSPHEYRNAAEAMLRRIVKGNSLYHINNVVEINNLISVSSGYSIGSYDTAQLTDLLELRVAPEGAHYEGIGKNNVNIGRLPVLYDEWGAFGNPTSDSQRTMIKNGKRIVMSVIYSFDGKDHLKVWMENYAKELYQQLGVTNIETWVV